MAKEDEKLEIEDIKDPLEDVTEDEQIDIDEVVAEEKDEPKEEVKKEEVQKPLKEGKKDKKPKKIKKINYKVISLVAVTAFVTAALVLGGVYYYLNFMSVKEPEVLQDVPKETEDKEEEKIDEKVLYVSEVNGLRLRKEPNVSAEIIATMSYGTKLVILKEENGWIKVEHEGQTGWCSKQFTSPKNPLIYSNSDYGFELTFPASWNTFKFFESDAEYGAQKVASYVVGIRTSDSGWKESGVDSGYASLFALSIFEKSEWEKLNQKKGQSQPY